jgi:hypothetical protein
MAKDSVAAFIQMTSVDQYNGGVDTILVNVAQISSIRPVSGIHTPAITNLPGYVNPAKTLVAFQGRQEIIMVLESVDQVRNLVTLAGGTIAVAA